jgi:anti-sigma B factor antagonist
MNLTTTQSGEIQVITVNEARIDASVAIQFKDAMRSISDEGTSRILLDLSQVDFIDSSGLGAIVAAMKHIGSARKMDLSGLTPNVDKVFRLTRMDTIFGIHPSIEHAVAQSAG